MRLLLHRFIHTGDCTVGCITIPDGPDIFTIERPWDNNQPFISCIPTGVYPLEWDTTGRIKEVPRLRDTGPRTQINIHTANRAHELHGCIAPGLGWECVNGTDFLVRDSGKAMRLLMEFIHPEDQEDGADLLDQNNKQVFLDIRDFTTGM